MKRPKLAQLAQILRLAAPWRALETMELRAARLVEQELQELKLTVEDLRKLRKGDLLKIRLAENLHRETPMTLRWIAAALQMGSWHYVSHLLYQQRRKTITRSDSFAELRHCGSREKKPRNGASG